MLKSIFLGISGALVIYIAYVVYHTGAFRPVEISMVSGEELQIVYKDHVGPYHKISPKIQQVEKWLSQFNIDCRDSFGLFLDDPQVVPEDRLRSQVGCLVRAPKQDPSQKIHHRVIAAREYLQARFAGSPAIGPYKVYPQVLQRIEEEGLQLDGPILEIYRMHSGDQMTTEYLFPIITQRTR